MEKRYSILLAFLIIAALVIIYALYPKQDTFSDNPQDWINDKGKGVKEIDVEEATVGAGYIDKNSLQYETFDIGTAFTFEGWYKGNYFETEYVDENGATKMRISQDMKPFDGIPEGFIIEKIEENKPIAYIFLDNDWRNKIKESIIYWGKGYQNEQPFDFSQQADKGIYVNMIEDDPNRFQNNYNLKDGGIWVGHLDDTKTSTLISFS